jgi:hypothetical protein
LGGHEREIKRAKLSALFHALNQKKRPILINQLNKYWPAITPSDQGPFAGIEIEFKYDYQGKLKVYASYNPKADPSYQGKKNDWYKIAPYIELKFESTIAEDNAVSLIEKQIANGEAPTPAALTKISMSLNELLDAAQNTFLKFRRAMLLEAYKPFLQDLMDHYHPQIQRRIEGIDVDKIWVNLDEGARQNFAKRLAELDTASPFKSAQLIRAIRISMSVPYTADMSLNFAKLLADTLDPEHESIHNGRFYYHIYVVEQSSFKDVSRLEQFMRLPRGLLSSGLEDYPKQVIFTIPAAWKLGNECKVMTFTSEDLGIDKEAVSINSFVDYGLEKGLGPIGNILKYQPTLDFTLLGNPDVIIGKDFQYSLPERGTNSNSKYKLFDIQVD